jgi:hypothetical protein
MRGPERKWIKTKWKKGEKDRQSAGVMKRQDTLLHHKKESLCYAHNTQQLRFQTLFHFKGATHIPCTFALNVAPEVLFLFNAHKTLAHTLRRRLFCVKHWSTCQICSSVIHSWRCCCVSAAILLPKHGSGICSFSEAVHNPKANGSCIWLTMRHTYAWWREVLFLSLSHYLVLQWIVLGTF